MNTFKQYLEEGRDAPLYHATTLYFIIKILNTNMLKRSFADKIHPGNGTIVSLTRNFTFAKKWVYDSGFILELDQRKLAQRYKIVPFNYFQDSARKQPLNNSEKDYIFTNQYEEAILQDVKDLDKYLIKIIALDLDNAKKSNVMTKYPSDVLLNHSLLYDYKKKEFVNK